VYIDITKGVVSTAEGGNSEGARTCPSSPSRPKSNELLEKAENEKLRRHELKRVNDERDEYLQNVAHQSWWHHSRQQVGTLKNMTSNRIGVERAKTVPAIYLLTQSTIAVPLGKGILHWMSNLGGGTTL
jgi:hypothetical protein